MRVKIETNIDTETNLSHRGYSDISQAKHPRKPKWQGKFKKKFKKKLKILKSFSQIKKIALFCSGEARSAPSQTKTKAESG